MIDVQCDVYSTAVSVVVFLLSGLVFLYCRLNIFHIHDTNVTLFAYFVSFMFPSFLSRWLDFIFKWIEYEVSSMTK